MSGLLVNIMRMLLGFTVAFFTAGAISGVFSVTSRELLDPSTPFWDNFGLWTLYSTTVVAMFSTPITMLAVIYCEWKGIRKIIYYIVIGVATSAIGFTLVTYNDSHIVPSLNYLYAAIVFLMKGIFSGAIYWVCAGRFAKQSGSVRNIKKNIASVLGPVLELRPASTAHSQLQLSEDRWQEKS